MPEHAPVVLWQMPPLWGLPNPSPFCMKLETWLRMAGIDYVAKPIDGAPKSASGKMPYIERPDGTMLSDSSVIIATLSREHGVTLDEFMTETDRVQALLIQRLFEDDLYFSVLHDRWVVDGNWEIVRNAYFGHFPWILRTLVVPLIRRKVIATARGQGIARLPPSERERRVADDVRAIDALLADKPYFLGQPSSVDAIAYAFLDNALRAPIASPLKDELGAYPRLSAYCDRMRAAYFADWRPTT
jgi:glutathione S-transferase